MAIIDPSAVPVNLPPVWTSKIRQGSRILFWTLLLSPLLFTLTEFFFKIGLALSRSEENATLVMTWDKWAPFIPMTIGLGSLAGVWLITTPSEGKLNSKQDLRRNLLRPAAVMMVTLLLLQAVSGFSGQQPQGFIFEWLPRLITTGFVALFLFFIADIADVLDQYPLRIISITMAAYFGCILGCDILDLIFAGTGFGSVVLPVVAMGKLALALVSMSGLLIATGKLHRLLKSLPRP